MHFLDQTDMYFDSNDYMNEWLSSLLAHIGPNALNMFTSDRLFQSTLMF